MTTPTNPPPTAPASAEPKTCIECGGPLQWRCPACRIAQSKDVAAPPQLAEGERAAPVADEATKAMYVAAHGSDDGWLGVEGSYFISGVRAALDSQAAELARLRAELVEANEWVKKWRSLAETANMLQEMKARSDERAKRLGLDDDAPPAPGGAA